MNSLALISVAFHPLTRGVSRSKENLLSISLACNCLKASIDLFWGEEFVENSAPSGTELKNSQEIFLDCKLRLMFFILRPLRYRKLNRISFSSLFTHLIQNEEDFFSSSRRTRLGSVLFGESTGYLFRLIWFMNRNVMSTANKFKCRRSSKWFRMKGFAGKLKERKPQYGMANVEEPAMKE